MKIDVFISHHTDSSLHIVEAIVNKLEANGVRCWYAPRDTRGAYANSIIEAIESCSIFLLILNKPSSESVHVLNELDMVTKRLSNKEEVTVIPFHTADDDISKDAQYYLGRMHWIDAITPPLEERIQYLIKIIDTTLNRSFATEKSYHGLNINHNTVLRSTPFVKNNALIGREKELSDLHQLLKNDRVVFITGIGGTGKTELVNQYISQFVNEYHTIIAAKYESSLVDTIISEKYFYIKDFDRNPMESDCDFAERKLEKIKAITDRDTLIVIDNFDAEDDEMLDAVLQAPYQIIFTTRMNFDYLGVPAITLGELEYDKQIELFKQNYRRPLTENQLPLLDELLKLIQGHTLTIELVARLMATRHMKLKKMLEQLKTKGLSPEISGAVHHKTTKAQTIYSHIEAIFNLDSLSEEELSVMQNLSLMPLAGVRFDSFIEWCHYESGEVIHNLIDRSWVKYDSENDIISMHPVISGIVRSKVTDNGKAFETMFNEIGKYFNRSWHLNRAERVEYGEIAKSLYYKIMNTPYESFKRYYVMHPIFVNLDLFDLGIDSIKKMKSMIINEESVELAWYFYAVSDFCLRFHFFDETVSYIIRSIELMRNVYPNSFDLAYILKHAAHIYHAICKYKGINKEYLDKAHKCLLESERVFQISVNNLDKEFGSFYYNFGLEADVEVKSQIASRKYAFGCNSYYSGRYEEAMMYCEESYQLFMELHGELNNDTQAPMMILSMAYSKLNRLDDAVDMISRVTAAREILWGKDSYRYCDCLDILGSIYLEHGKVDDGLKQLYYILEYLSDKKEIYANYIQTIEDKIEKYSS